MSYSSVALPPPVRRTLASRVGSSLRPHLALAAAATTLVFVWAGLVVTHEAPRLAVPGPAALRAALADPTVTKMLATTHWDRWDVTAIDSRSETLELYRGPRIVATVDVGSGSRPAVLAATDLAKQKYVYGSGIANDGRVLALLSVVFVLMTGVWPLWRLRNLDVLMTTSLVLSVVLWDRLLLTRMVLVSYSALTYLALRCSWWALGRRRDPGPAVPLYDRVTRGWTAAQQLRVLRLVGLAMVLAVVMVGASSQNVIDVGYAVMEGATAIVHGVVPYGHIPDVLHGDTYPIGSYLLYVPFAWLSPVRTVWDDADVTLVVAVVAGLAAAGGLARLTARASRDAGARAPSAAERSGLRAGIAFLTFPPLLVTVSTGTTDIVLAAMLVAVLVLWRRPTWATAVLSAAAWFKLVPLALMPLLLARLRGRALGLALSAIALVSAIMLAGLLALGGVDAFGRMLSAMSFQFTRSSPHTLWAVVGNVPFQQLAQAATVALIVGAVVRTRLDTSLAADRARLAAVAAAILIGIQISANYWNFMYLVWVFPFIAVSLLAEPGHATAAPVRRRVRPSETDGVSRGERTSQLLAPERR